MMGLSAGTYPSLRWPRQVDEPSWASHLCEEPALWVIVAACFEELREKEVLFYCYSFPSMRTLPSVWALEFLVMKPSTYNSGHKGFVKNVGVTTQLWPWGACSSVGEKACEVKLGRQDE